MKLFKILERMTEEKVHFCLNVHPDHRYYNLSVKDRRGTNHYRHADNIEEIEEALIMFYGDLLDAPTPKVAIPVPPSMPLPGGMPLP